ncbi:MAG: hypothetical protein ABMB14_08110 [Myxococcota bacterium]
MVTFVRIPAEKKKDEKCTVEVHTFSGHGVAEGAAAEVPTPMATINAPCPASATLTWIDHRVVVVRDDGDTTDLTAGADPKKALSRLPKTPPGVAAFDENGVLHACAKMDAFVDDKDGQKVAQRNGETLTTAPIAGAHGYGLFVRWEQGAYRRWYEKGQGVLAMVDPSEVPECDRLDGFPQTSRWVSTAGQRQQATDWTAAHPDDAGPLGALQAGAWVVDPTRTLAVVGALPSARFGPVAAWVGGAWAIVHPDEDVTAVWVDDDWLGLRTIDGVFRLVSRSDGAEVFTAPDGVVALPWPAAAPDPGTEPPKDFTVKKPTPDRSRRGRHR